jgi:tripartite-type tricarboxylate transporter receptor subunit TctC
VKLPRRTFLHLTAGAALVPVNSRIATPQTYPARPVHIIVGFGPGGAPVIVSRLLGRWLTERLGQPFVVEVRSGAGSNIATESVVNAPPDGYTLLMGGLPNAINATLYDNLNFNFTFLKGYEATTWWGIGVPRNTPAEIVDRLNKEINAALTNADMRRRLEEVGASVLGGSAADFGKLIAEETEKWGKLIRAAKIKPE